MSSGGWNSPGDRGGTHIGYIPGRWVEEAACAQTDPEVFFPEKGQSSARAKMVCRVCPVINECLRWTLAAPFSLDGVWGGTTERQRRELRRLGASKPSGYTSCGTPAGANRHYRNNEPPCQPCRRANAQAVAKRRAQ